MDKTNRVVKLCRRMEEIEAALSSKDNLPKEEDELLYELEDLSQELESLQPANDCEQPKRPYNTGTKKRTYTVTEEDHKALRKLGNGNASAGIRESVRKATKLS